jgi:threonine dehydrogenase-like Zn-dependent dehydrogenase
LALVAEFGGQPVARNEAVTSVDLVLEATGSSAVVRDGVKALRPGGHYVWVGMVHPETPLDLTGESVLRKCLTVRGVHNYAPKHLAAGLAFLVDAHTRLPFEKLASPPLPLDKLHAGIEMTRRREWQRVCIRP